MGDQKHKSSSRRIDHDGTKHTKDVHIGHSRSKDKLKSSQNQNIRWNCSQCGWANNSVIIDTQCPNCDWIRGPSDVTWIFPEGGTSGIQRSGPEPFNGVSKTKSRLKVEPDNDGIDIETKTVQEIGHVVNAKSRPKPFDGVFWRKTNSPIEQQIKAKDHNEKAVYTANRRIKWIICRYIVTQLYIIEEFPLKTKAESMRKEYQLHLTHIMFKHHYKRWQLHKNLSTRLNIDSSKLLACAREYSEASVAHGDISRKANQEPQIEEHPRSVHHVKWGLSLADIQLAMALRLADMTKVQAKHNMTRSNDTCQHLHQDKYLGDIEADVARFLLSLPEELRYNLQLENMLVQPCWTCIPSNSPASYIIPLTIANLPVVVPVRMSYPLNPGLTPPPDPHPYHISPTKELHYNAVEQILDTFEEAIGFYLLVNGMLQLIVPDHFDFSSAMNCYPGRFGGMKVSYVLQSQVPTAGETQDSTMASSTKSDNLGDVFSIPTNSAPASTGSNFTRASNERGLVVGSSVRAQVNETKSRNRYQAKLGLMTKALDRTYLTLPTHMITQALAGSKLDWRWPHSGFEDVSLVAGNNNTDLGKMAKTFDQNARSFPDGFEHDVSLVDVSNLPATVTSSMKPCIPLEWVSDQDWANLQFNTKNLFLLDDKDQDVKSIGLRPSQFQMVGQGIFANRQKSKRWSVREALTRGKQKASVPDEMEACTYLVARSILYRVAQEYEAPGGQSGTPVCLLDDTEPGIKKGKVAGFTSYVQMVQDIQHYHIEGDQLAQRLQDGRVAFYGAFKVPLEMREQHDIL
ncbi:hypothetical protein PG993_011205 [Apiospora rasikravindrae]|uniref:RanBP2-type domain-containing protein n=1 Tax=Apiospora rasikravindrae TaxID=990691 RepID=A0ABR1SDJ6_9PEZI